MSDVTKGRDMLAETSRLAPALRFVAQNPDKQLSFVCGKFQVSPTDMWAWFGQFNGGKKDVSETRLNGVLLKAGLIPDNAELAAAAAEVEAEDSAPPPIGRALKSLRNSARNTAGSGKYDRPWLKLRWRKDGFASWEDVLERLAKDPTQTLVAVCEGKTRAMIFAGWKRRMLGEGAPSPEQIQELLAFGRAKADGDADVVAAQPATRARKAKVSKEKKVRQPKEKKAKRKYTRRMPLPEVVADTLANAMQPPPTPGAPVVGLRPRWQVEEERMFEIAGAAKRYVDAGLTIPVEWVGELLPLICNFNQRRAESQGVQRE